MKIQRYKKAEKRLNFFIKNFQFHAPFQVLIDGTYAHACLQSKSRISELSNYLQSELKFLTTACVITEVEKLGTKFTGTQKILKDLKIHKCHHQNKAVSGYQCFKSMIRNGNPNRYIVATQDKELKMFVRGQPSVPLIYLYGSTPTFEKPSNKCEIVAHSQINEHLSVQKHDEQQLNKLMKDNQLEVSKTMKRKKRRGPKRPNPLSCKKKTVLERRKKNRQDQFKVGNKIVRIPNHVKDELMKKVEE